MRSNGTTANRLDVLPSKRLPMQFVDVVGADGVVSSKCYPCSYRVDDMLNHADIYNNLAYQMNNGMLKEVPIPTISPSSDSFDESFMDNLLTETSQEQNNN